MDFEFVKYLILQAPNLIGLIIALYLMREQNKELIRLLRECNAAKNGENGETLPE